VEKRFDDFYGIIGGLSTDLDLDSNIPKKCQKCPLLAGTIEALKTAWAQKKALERTALETAGNIKTWLRVQGMSEEEIEQILEDSERLEEARVEYGRIVEMNLAIGSAALNQLLPGIERQTAGCPGIIKCTSRDGETVVEVCGSPTMPNGKSDEVTTVRRTGRGEQDPSEPDTSDQ